MRDLSEDLIHYRMERAKETFNDARLMAVGKSWNSCINRLYYACFYAVSALLILKNMSSPKQIGIRSLFNLHYVKTGKVSKEMGKLYNDLFESRQEGDYEDFIRFTEEDVAPMLFQAENFIELIGRLIAEEI